MFCIDSCILINVNLVNKQPKSFSKTDRDSKCEDKRVFRRGWKDIHTWVISRLVSPLCQTMCVRIQAPRVAMKGSNLSSWQLTWRHEE